MSDKLVNELSEFVTQNENMTLKIAACENVKGLTSDASGIQFIVQHRTLFESLLKFDEFVEQAQILLLESLINISSDENAVQEFNEKSTLIKLSRCICAMSSISDKCCMVMNNISRQPKVCQTLISSQMVVDGVKINLLDNLLNTFSKCATTTDSKCTLDHLAFVIMNLTQTNEGRVYCLSAGPDRIVQILPHLKSSSAIRRQGIAAAIRNCLFEHAYHKVVLSKDVELLPALLLPLMDGFEYKEDENDSLPLDLQYLPTEKTRENVSQIREILVECLMLLCATEHGRKLLKDSGTYYVLRELHNWELENKNEQNSVQTEKVIHILIGDEPEEGMKNLLEVEIPDSIKSQLEAEN